MLFDHFSAKSTRRPLWVLEGKKDVLTLITFTLSGTWTWTTTITSFHFVTETWSTVLYIYIYKKRNFSKSGFLYCPDGLGTTKKVVFPRLSFIIITHTYKKKPHHRVRSSRTRNLITLIYFVLNRSLTKAVKAKPDYIIHDWTDGNSSKQRSNSFRFQSFAICVNVAWCSQSAEPWFHALSLSPVRAL